MATTMTSEVINKSNIEVEVKESNAGANRILSALKGNGDRFSIKLAANSTYREYVLGTKHVVGKEKADGGGSTFVISSDDCAEFETILIKNGRVDPKKLRLEYIKRGVSVTEVVNQTDRCFNLKHGNAVLELLKPEGEYLIQRDPKADTSLDYVLVEAGGKKARISISIQDVADYQRITIVETGGVVDLGKVRRGRYLMEVHNKTGTEFKVNRLERGGAPTLLATLQKHQDYVIDYDPATKGCEYWVESAAQKLSVKADDFVNSLRMDIIIDSPGGTAKLQSVEPRPAPASTGVCSIL